MGPSRPGGNVHGDGPAQRVGSLPVVLDGADGVDRSSYTTDDGTEISLTSAQLDLLQVAGFEDRTPTTVDLGAQLGDFRVAAQTVDGTTVIAGNSLEDVSADRHPPHRRRLDTPARRGRAVFRCPTKPSSRLTASPTWRNASRAANSRTVQ